MESIRQPSRSHGKHLYGPGPVSGPVSGLPDVSGHLHGGESLSPGHLPGQGQGHGQGPGGQGAGPGQLANSREELALEGQGREDTPNEAIP